MNLGDKGKALIKEFEGCRLTAYPDPKTGGDPWTIGYGWTQPIDGKKVTKGMTITQQKAEQLFEEGVKPYANTVNSLVKVPLTQNQFDALTSFVYNLGAKNFTNSTLLRKLNNKDYKGAADEFPKWISKGTPAEKGLTRRRAAERNLFLS